MGKRRITRTCNGDISGDPYHSAGHYGLFFLEGGLNMSNSDDPLRFFCRRCRSARTFCKGWSKSSQCRSLKPGTMDPFRIQPWKRSSIFPNGVYVKSANRYMSIKFLKPVLSVKCFLNINEFVGKYFVFPIISK